MFPLVEIDTLCRPFLLSARSASKRKKKTHYRPGTDSLPPIAALRVNVCNAGLGGARNQSFFIPVLPFLIIQITHQVPRHYFQLLGPGPQQGRKSFTPRAVVVCGSCEVNERTCVQTTWRERCSGEDFFRHNSLGCHLRK